MVVEVPFKELEVVPDFTGLVVAAVGFAFEDGDVGLWNCQRQVLDSGAVVLCRRAVLLERSVSDERERSYPSRSTVAVYVLLESHDAFVEVVVVVCAHIDKDTVTQDLAKVLCASPVVCDVA